MKILQILIFASACTLSHSVLAISSVDMRLEHETWNTGINGKTTAFLLGLGGTHSLNPSWLLAGGFITGKHDNDNKNSTQDSLKRNDVDFAVGYRLSPKITVLAGYRLVRIKYENALDSNRSFTDLTHGLGAGISAYQSITLNTLVYTRLSLSGLLSTLKSEKTGTDRGLGLSTSLEAGVVYQLIEDTNLGFSIKLQNTSIDYRGDSEKWNHNYIRLGLSLSHYF